MYTASIKISVGIPSAPGVFLEHNSQISFSICDSLTIWKVKKFSLVNIFFNFGNTWMSAKYNV